ncbi:MAG: general secretion pathway protein GspK [Gemmatimonadales bacterium]|jgi:general secretion pathway protein K
MKTRRGVALLLALWLVVAIAVVVLQFSLEAKERRTLGLNAAERGQSRAAAAGALAMVEAKLDYALRVAPTSTTGNVGLLRASDPWLGADSLYSGTVDVDSLPVVVQALDLGERLNINDLTEDQLRTFLAFVLNDYATADQLADAIMDWIDVDDIPRIHGAEKDDYIKAGLLALPANAPFREVEELLQVKGMTPEIYAAVSPFLTTRGSGAVNLNSAPAPVLRALPGMTDAILARIISMRSQGQRIQSVAQVLPPQPRGRQTTFAQQAGAVTLEARSTVTTQQVLLTILARTGPQAQLVRFRAIVQRNGTTANIGWKEW